MKFIKEKFKSKKVRALIAGLAAVGMEYLGVDKVIILKVVGLLSSYMIGQGIADNGKEAAKIKAGQ